MRKRYETNALAIQSSGKNGVNVKQALVGVFSLHILAHIFVHIVSLFPIILELVTHHSHQGQTYQHIHLHLGNSIMQSIILTILLHAMMSLFVVKYVKTKDKGCFCKHQ